MIPSLPPLPDAPNPPDEHSVDIKVGNNPTIKELLPYFVSYLTHETRVSKSTLRTYGTCIRRIVRIVGDMRPEDLTVQEVLNIKSSMAADGVGPAFVRLVATTSKTFLRFCKLILNLQVLAWIIHEVSRQKRK